MNNKEFKFNKLPSDIKELIFKNNRQYNNNINRDKKLAEFWDEWGDYYDDDLEDWCYDEVISNNYWEGLTVEDKIIIYKFHEKRQEIHDSIMCDGSAPDWYYELEPESDEE